MCRLMLFNRSFLHHISIEELAGLFVTLDFKNGGHGVGLALCYDKNDPVIHKGVELSPAELAGIVYGEKDNPDLSYAIFHARVGTSGGITDDMCHPFSEGTKFGLTMAHNGVIHSLSGSDTHSDTKIAFDMITRYGMGLNFLSDLSGVFVGCHKKMPFVIKPSSYSDLDLCYTPGYDAWCFCSSFYHYTQVLKKRFIVQSKLRDFIWSKTLDSKAVNKMLGNMYKDKWNTAKGYTSSGYKDRGEYWSTTNNQSLIHTEPIKIGGYPPLKRRIIGKQETWHEQDCRDWYCEGECIGVVE